MKKSLVIFASGSGSNAENLIRYYRENENVSIKAVLTNNPKAGVIERARKLNTECIVFSPEQFADQRYFIGLLQNYSPDLIVLAGFLKLIPVWLIDAYPKRIINLHPALLPAYGGKGMYGRKVHEAVLSAGEKQSGITFHYVNDHYDEGEVIKQVTLDLRSDETVESLEARIHELEHQWFPKVVDRVLALNS